MTAKSLTCLLFQETSSRAALPKELGPKVIDKKSAKREEIQQKLLLTMILSALVIFLLLASSLFQNELNLEQGDGVVDEECEDDAPAWVGPGVFWTQISENRLRQWLIALGEIKPLLKWSSDVIPPTTTKLKEK